MTALPGPARRRFRLVVVLGSIVVAIVGSVALAIHGSGEAMTTQGVTATLPLSGHPGSVATGRDALWIALSDTRTPVGDLPLLHLDLASDTVGLPLFLGGKVTYVTHVGDKLLASVERAGGSGSGPSMLVVLDWRDGHVLARRQFAKVIGPLVRSGTDLWALQLNPAALLRLDPRTLAPISVPLALSRGRAVGLAAGGGYVWVTAADAGEVLRVDASTRSITRVHVAGVPAGIAYESGSVWVADRGAGEVGRLDPRTLRPIGKPARVGGKPGWLTRAGRYLFVSDATRGTVSRIDVRSGHMAGMPIRVAPPARAAPPLAVTPSGDSVWVSSFASRTLTRVSSTSSSALPVAVPTDDAREIAPNVLPLPFAGKVVASIRVPSEGGAFAVGEGSVWAMSDTTSTLMRIDPRRNAVVARIKVSPGEAAAVGDGAVWLSHPEDDTVTRIDPKTNRVSATIHVPGQPTGVAVSPGAVWVTDALGPSLTRIDPITDRIVATIRVGRESACCSPHMSVIASNDAVWVALPSGLSLVRVDPRTNRVVASVELGYVPCGFLATYAKTVWSAGGGCSDSLARIDPGATRPSAQLAVPHPVGVALAFGSVWVASTEAGNVERIDPRTARVVARLHVGGFPVRLAVAFGSVWVNDDTGHVLRIEPQG